MMMDSMPAGLRGFLLVDERLYFSLFDFHIG